MSGIGAGHNKFESCKGCPDRCADPNCHDRCEGYKYRMKKKDEAKRRKWEQWEGCMTESVRKNILRKRGQP